jgi:hypothetical protein
VKVQNYKSLNINIKRMCIFFLIKQKVSEFCFGQGGFR